VYLAGAYHSGKDQTPADTPRNDATNAQLILAVGQPRHGQDDTTGSSKNDTGLTMPDLGRGFTGQRQRSTSINSSVSADENAGSIFAAPPLTLAADRRSPAPMPAAGAPAFADLTASELWCKTCKRSVPFRTLVQLDGAAVYLCEACDTQVGHKAPPPPATGSQREQKHGGGPVGSGGRARDSGEGAKASALPENGTAHGECPRCGADDMTLMQRQGQRACVGCSTLSDTELARMRAALAASPLAPSVPNANPSPSNGAHPPQDTLPQPQAAREVFEI